MGVTVREKVKGSKVYWLFISHDRKRVSRRVGDKKAAELAATQIRAKLALGDLGVFEPVAAPPPVVAVPTFGVFALAWLARRADSGGRPGTLAIYESGVTHHLVPFFGGRPLPEITATAIEDLISHPPLAGRLRWH